MQDVSNSPAISNAAATSAIIFGALIAFAVFLIPLIFYILTLQKALNRCSPESRAMQPGLIWLLVIPCVGLVWHFFVVLNMAKSLAAEFQKRGIQEEPTPGQMIGLIACGLMAGGIIPLIGPLFSLGGIVCWIIYWVKIAGFSKKLAT